MPQITLAHPSASHHASPTGAPELTGRLLIALLFIGSGIQKALAFDSVAGWMAGEGVPYAAAVLAATILLEVVAGAALAAGFALRATGGLLAAFVVAATLVFHPFWSVPVEQFADQLTHFLKNAAILGGLLLAARRARPAT